MRLRTLNARELRVELWEFPDKTGRGGWGIRMLWREEKRANNKEGEKFEEMLKVLEKDDNNLAGFKCVTTYPNISKYSKTATPTGRNLLPDLTQTRTFKQNAEDQPIWTLYGHRSAVTGMNQRTKHPIQAYQTRALQNETKYYFRFNIKICYDRAYIYIYIAKYKRNTLTR